MVMQKIKRLLKPLIGPPLQAAESVLRRRQLKAELSNVTLKTLVDDLEALDLPTGAVLLVHSALKSLGFVEGGPRSVVEALVEVVVRRRGGTLALPTFSIFGNMHSTLASERVFDVRATPSNLGAVPEAFRLYPGVRRSIHPSHSISALGSKADWITEAHHVCGSNFGPESPMVRIMEAGGFLTGLGTGLGTVTFYHCLEDIEPDFPIQVYSNDSPFSVTCLDWEGTPHVIKLQAHGPTMSTTRIDRPANEAIRSFFTQRLEERAGLRWFEIGRGRGWLVPLGEMYGECRHLMQSGITIYTTAEELAQRQQKLDQR